MKFQFQLSTLLLATVAAGAWIGVYVASTALDWSWHEQMSLRDDKPITLLEPYGSDYIVTATGFEVSLWSVDGKRESSMFTTNPVEFLSCADRDVGITVLEKNGMVHLWNPHENNEKSYLAQYHGETMFMARWKADSLHLLSEDAAGKDRFRNINPESGMVISNTFQPGVWPGIRIGCSLSSEPPREPPGTRAASTPSGDPITILPNGTATVWKRVEENVWIRQSMIPMILMALASTVFLITKASQSTKKARPRRRTMTSTAISSTHGN